MVRKRGEHGVIILTAVFLVCFTVLGTNYYRLAVEQKNVPAAQESRIFTYEVGRCQGTIYDTKMRPLTNAETHLEAVAVPSMLDRESTAEYAVDREKFYEEYDKGLPFEFECTKYAYETDGLTIFEVPQRYSENQTARHVIGYLSDNEGADGVEYAYNSILRADYPSNSVTYETDGFGRILSGNGKSAFRTNSYKSGVVLTIDKDIQKICEDCGKGIKTGAIVCADIKSGDILAMASFPDYAPEKLEEALKNKDCPLINRALYSYSVGSVFKLVTAAEALEEGKGDIVYNCCGNTDVDGKLFNCHKLDGHGIQNISEAMTNSCNTYFIELSRCLELGKLRERAYSLGFGRENYLCTGIVGSAGVLPTEKELSIPAEMANFAFGQGKLSATPLQITQLTCTIANGGKRPVLRLIKGLTADGETVGNEKNPRYSQAVSEETADELRKMMILAVRDNENSKARTNKMSVGAKTSTAQTGKTNSKGEELCHAWITGFFPARQPKYAVTVFIENGGYGNDAAAPVFRNIAEKIKELGEKS